MGARPRHLLRLVDDGARSKQKERKGEPRFIGEREPRTEPLSQKSGRVTHTSWDRGIGLFSSALFPPLGLERAFRPRGRCGQSSRVHRTPLLWRMTAAKQMDCELDSFGGLVRNVSARNGKRERK